MRLCAADNQKRGAFVQMRGAGLLHEYNSNSPMVVYVPNGFQVKFRIWSASDDLGNAQKQ